MPSSHRKLTSAAYLVRGPWFRLSWPACDAVTNRRRGRNRRCPGPRQWRPVASEPDNATRRRAQKAVQEAMDQPGGGDSAATALPRPTTNTTIPEDCQSSVRARTPVLTSRSAPAPLRSPPPSGLSCWPRRGSGTYSPITWSRSGGRRIVAGTTPWSSRTGRSPSTRPRRCFRYGQEIFEGLKAYRQADVRSRSSGRVPTPHGWTRSAARLAMPELPTDLFVRSIELLVRQDLDWVPTA